MALKQYWNSQRGDNFLTGTTDGEADAAAAGYTQDRVEGYALPVGIPNPEASNNGDTTSRFPLQVSKSWQQSAMHMRTDLFLTQQGQLRGFVHTWSTWWFRGFHGGCVVLVSDANSNVLWSTVRKYGVDGTAVTILGKSSSRADFILEQLPDDAAGKAYRLDVMLSHMPEVMLKKIVEEVKARVKTVVDAGREIAEYIGA